MVTDSPPRGAKAQQRFYASDALAILSPLPEAPRLQATACRFDSALKSGERRPVQRAGEEILELLAATYGVRRPALRILGSRPRRSGEDGGYSELFGDYAFDTQRIRLWMRTAVLGRVTSYRGALNTLVHEFCHHLDIQKLGFAGSPHTRGFYARVDDLYHLALATPADRRKPLVWLRMGRRWRIDWRRVRPSRVASPAPDDRMRDGVFDFASPGAADPTARSLSPRTAKGRGL